MSPIVKLLEKIISLADEKKALNIVTYHVAERSSLTEYVVVMGALNKVHCHALESELEKEIIDYLNANPTNEFYKPRISGTSESEWIILDLNSIIIHIQTEETRQFYGLDPLFEKRGVVYHY